LLFFFFASKHTMPIFFFWIFLFGLAVDLRQVIISIP
jgi:hypothetical protein